jgi:hypothetical protein
MSATIIIFSFRAQMRTAARLMYPTKKAMTVRELLT